jgi:CRISP-associated protein Cas1
MRKLLNTLYITTPESYLSRDGLNVVVLIKNEEKFRIPIHNIESIVTFGYMGASPALMRLCVENNVSLSFLSPNGNFIARIVGPIHGNVLLRMNQYKFSHDASYALNISKIIIAGKIYNYRQILQRHIRDYGCDTTIDEAIKNMKSNIGEIKRVETPDNLRGIEGNAATEYFGVFQKLILEGKDFTFNGRNKRPPKDPVNAMLSFVYTLIAHEVQSSLETIGLDPYVGFFHTLRPGRASLALDMMEELRAYLGDRLVLSLINRRQISTNGFKYQGDENVIMNDDTKRIIINAWQNRKKDEFIHPYLKEKIPVGLLPYVQAKLLASYIRGDIDNYPVFTIQ